MNVSLDGGSDSNLVDVGVKCSLQKRYRLSLKWAGNLLR